MAKAAYWTETDTEARKRGEQTGLDTPVSYTHLLTDNDRGSKFHIKSGSWLSADMFIDCKDVQDRKSVV